VLVPAGADRLRTVDPVSPASGVLRLLSRRLTAYGAAVDSTGFRPLVADLARELPSEANGGISADGLTYTFHLRTGAAWNSTPKRAITAADHVRGIKMICASARETAAMFTATLVGLADYCAAPSATKEVAGVSAPDDSTIVFTLRRPTSDFLSLLSLPAAAPVPTEPDKLLSSGPYQVAEHQPGRRLVLTRNPAWIAANDPIRSAHPDSIIVMPGATPADAFAQIRAGSADIAIGLPVPPPDITPLIAANDSNLVVGPGQSSYASVTRLLVNVVSPNVRGVLRSRDTRRALAFAVDRAAIVQLMGGPQVARAAQQLMPPTWTGSMDAFSPFATVADRAWATRTQEILTVAGIRDTLRLKMLVPPGEQWSVLGTTIQTQFASAGVRVDIAQTPATMTMLADAAAARRGAWDLALGTVTPDWHADNNGRAFLRRYFAAAKAPGGGSANYGLYESEAVDSMFEQALSVRNPADARGYWDQAAATVLEDAAWIPVTYNRVALYHSARTRRCVVEAASMGCDLAVIWLRR
jgi:ABC-type transport system substrate-binding protein